MSVLGVPRPLRRDPLVSAAIGEWGGAPIRARAHAARPFLLWLGFMAYVAVAKILLNTFLPHAFASAGQAAAFSWPFIIAIGAAGLVGVWFARRTGFSPAWTPKVGATRQVVVPALIGVGLAIVLIVFDLATGATRVINESRGVEQQFTDMRSMFLIFSTGAIYVEPIYRLLLIPLPLWLVSKVLLRGRFQVPVFWTVALLASALEPLDQLAAPAAQLGVARLGFLAAHGFALNLVQAGFFRRYGFVASIAVREGFYFLWHVLYVH
jgi:hypothetical protein